jgi:hypothetical protein
MPIIDFLVAITEFDDALGGSFLDLKSWPEGGHQPIRPGQVLSLQNKVESKQEFDKFVNTLGFADRELLGVLLSASVRHFENMSEQSRFLGNKRSIRDRTENEDLRMLAVMMQFAIIKNVYEMFLKSFNSKDT